MSRTSQRVGSAVVAIAALALVTGAGAARGPELSLVWQGPTPADGASLTVTAGEPVTLELAAASSQPRLVLISKRRLPTGATFAAAYGKPGVATFTWTPTGAQTGEHVLTFSAQTLGAPRAFARPRTFFVFVLSATPGQPLPLNGPNGMSRWAPILDVVSARARPSASAKVITRLQPVTPEQTDNLVVALNSVVNEKGQHWVRIRLPVLPNGTTGWVPRDALGGFTQTWTHLVVDRPLFMATLYRHGKPVFRSRIGVGKAYWPTPAGEFYVRERITGFSDLIYGPLAFGTNARSAVLTDWPGGGFIGIHGTNQPEILPGRVSHGCIRMPNASIRRLARLMPLGTPVTVN
jgi:hypothetical protein